MKVGFIGIGQMGRHMSRRVLEAGFDLAVHDLNREAAQPALDRGAKWMATPKEMAQSCDVIISCLPGPPEVEAVVYGADGLLAGWKKGDIYVDMSTNLPATMRRVAEDGLNAGVAVLDAPVLGGQVGAESGTLVIAVGGDAQALEKVRKLLSSMGNRIHHMGDVGAGNVTKIINNLLSTTANAINGEGLMLGARAGLNIKKLWEVVTSSPGNNWWLEKGYPRTLFRGYFEGFKISLACKDVGLALELGKYYGVPMPVGSAVEQKYLEAKAAGLGDKATPALILRLEELLGVQVRSDEFKV